MVRVKGNVQNEAGYSASTRSCESQLREGKGLRHGNVSYLPGDILQLSVCEEQGRIFGHRTHNRRGQTLLGK
jgi:hypothetical protein